MLEDAGAWHTAELAFCFDNTARCAQGTGNGPEAQALARRMATAWANFARTGNPSQPGLAVDAVHTRWVPDDGLRRDVSHRQRSGSRGPEDSSELTAPAGIELDWESSPHPFREFVEVLILPCLGPTVVELATGPVVALEEWTNIKHAAAAAIGIGFVMTGELLHATAEIEQSEMVAWRPAGRRLQEHVSRVGLRRGRTRHRQERDDAL